jgi:hypothetical protein
MYISSDMPETPAIHFFHLLYRTILVANNIQLLRKEAAPTFSAQDISKIKKFSRQKNVVS